jgi:hypothetical protein
VNPKQVPVVEPTEAFTTEDIKFGGIKWNVWDVSGKKNVRSLWPTYYKEGGVDAILWVVDSTGTVFVVLFCFFVFCEDGVSEKFVCPVVLMYFCLVAFLSVCLFVC